MLRIDRFLGGKCVDDTSVHSVQRRAGRRGESVVSGGLYHWGLGDVPTERELSGCLDSRSDMQYFAVFGKRGVHGAVQ